MIRTSCLWVMLASAIAHAQPVPVQPAPAPAAAAAPKPATGASSDLRPENDEEEGAPKLSLPTEADRLAWQRPGFRLGLGAAYGQFAGLRGAPSGRLKGVKLRAGLRLDEAWSAIASFEYSLASTSGGISGLRFSGTIDPTWHVTRSLSLAIGFGFGGIVEGRPTRMDASPLPDTLESSYTFPDSSTPVASCSGVGVAGLVRGEWGYVLGPRAMLTVSVEAIGQWTGCIDDTGRVEPDTGKAIVRRQWWPHSGGTISVGVTFR